MKTTDTSNVRLIEKVYVQGALGAFLTTQPNRAVSMILCSVKQGAVDIFFGSYGDGDGRLVPDLHFGQTNRPVWVPLPCQQYEFTIVAADAQQVTYASVIFGGPAVG